MHFHSLEGNHGLDGFGPGSLLRLAVDIWRLPRDERKREGRRNHDVNLHKVKPLISISTGVDSTVIRITA